jgi:hypothetical protein
VQPHDITEELPEGGQLASTVENIEAQKLQFEARKFSLEMLIKMYLTQLEATRNLRVGHVKMTLALPFGALAGFLTVLAALARFTDDYPVWPEDRLALILLFVALGSFLTAAVVAISQYRAAVDRAADQLFHPYPGAETEFEDILFGRANSEEAYLDRLSIILQARTQDKRQHQRASSAVLLLTILGATAGTAALMIL